VGINEKGVVKVWMNREFSKNFIVGGKISQEQMVKGIVDILDSNCDTVRLNGIPTVRNYLYRNSDMLTFEQALRELNEYALTYNSAKVPQYLECIDRAGGIYVIANRETPEEQDSSNKNSRSIYTSPVQREFERPKLISGKRLSYENDNGSPLPSHHHIPHP
jgi:hypothetical protein